MSKREQASGKNRTKECATKYSKNKVIQKRKGFNYREHIVTSKLYCFCRDCLKYCNYREPVQCIDPYLMDMRHTYWIYHGLVMASKTERAISIVTPDNNQAKPEENKEKGTRT